MRSCPGQHHDDRETAVAQQEHWTTAEALDRVRDGFRYGWPASPDRVRAYNLSARAITQSNSRTRPVVSSRVTGYIPVISNPSASYTDTASSIRGMPS